VHGKGDTQHDPGPRPGPVGLVLPGGLRSREADRIDFDDFTLVYLRNSESEFELELTLNKGQSEPYDLGNGYGHIAFSVEDVESERQRFEEAGFEPRRLVELEKDGQVLGKFFFVQDPDGYQIEVLQRAGRYL
jgi:lactoylglutathione lyase